MSRIIKSRYPSNIALVKYWGKYGNQLPCNPSVSMTLKKAYTDMELVLSEKTKKEPEFEYYFEEKLNASFGNRVLAYLQKQEEFAPLLTDYAIALHSHNSFPHSAGIASSASAFAAIAAVGLQALDMDLGEVAFKQKASDLARRGSGSACRSFYDGYAAWGVVEGLSDSSEEYAVSVEDIHPDFQSMRDAILIIDDAPKAVSSSVGHVLMKDHPYAISRFEQGKLHSAEMILILKEGDFESFISVVEREALTLHAMMMTSKEYYLLVKPNTVFMIERLFEFRKETGLPVCFTLDAGPNLHILYPDSVREEVETFLEGFVPSYIKSIIKDELGAGGKVIK